MQVAAVPEGGGSARLTAWHLLTLGVAWSAALPLAALTAVTSDGGGGLAAALNGGWGLLPLSVFRVDLAAAFCGRGAAADGAGSGALTCAGWRVAPLLNLTNARLSTKLFLLSISRNTKLIGGSSMEAHAGSGTESSAHVFRFRHSSAVIDAPAVCAPGQARSGGTRCWVWTCAAAASQPPGRRRRRRRTWWSAAVPLLASSR